MRLRQACGGVLADNRPRHPRESVLQGLSRQGESGSDGRDVRSASESDFENDKRDEMREPKKYDGGYLFSNGTECAIWMERNCENGCVKAQKFDPRDMTWGRFYCAVQRDIVLAYLDDGKGTKRVYDICQQDVCPLKRTERKRYPKRDMNNQPNLFEYGTD